MTTDVSTKVYKINWKTLIDESLSAENWGKEFTIYHSGDFKVLLVVHSLLIHESKIKFYVRVEYLNGRHVDEGFFAIPWSKDLFNETVFQKRLLRTAVDSAKRVEADVILYNKEFTKMATSSQEFASSLTKEIKQKVLEELAGEDVDNYTLGLIIENVSPSMYLLNSSWSLALETEGWYFKSYMTGVASTLGINDVPTLEDIVKPETRSDDLGEVLEKLSVRMLELQTECRNLFEDYFDGWKDKRTKK